MTKKAQGVAGKCTLYIHCTIGDNVTQENIQPGSVSSSYGERETGCHYSNEDSPITSEMANDPDLYVVVEAFISEIPTFLDKIKNAWKVSDFEGLKEHLHQLKGAAACAKFEPIAEYSTQLEALLIDGQKSVTSGDIEKLSNLCKRASAAKRSEL